MSNDRTCSAARADCIVPAPDLPYRSPRPRRYNPPLGLIGCGGIAPFHLAAYRAMGLRVVALCDVDARRAKKLAREFYPDAAVFKDYRELLARRDIMVVDIATHVDVRPGMVEAALRAGKHVLSQKPFAADLARGAALAALAEAKGLKLAVNQNGRWAPHFSYMRHAVAKGLIGRVMAVHLQVHWDHNWTADTPFNEMHHLILQDFAIHWFDMVRCLMGRAKALEVYASVARAPRQRAKPPMLAQAMIRYANAQASLVFDASTSVGALDESVVIGTKGTLVSSGPDLQNQTVCLSTRRGVATPALAGRWFEEGFQGSMGELLCAIEEDRAPYHNVRHNLDSLALCFAAVRSADTGLPQRPHPIGIKRA